MARVIEPIGLLALLLRRATATSTNNATSINNICTIGNLRMYSSSSMRNGCLILEANSSVNYSSNKMFDFSRNISSTTNSILDAGGSDKKLKQKKATTIKKLHKANKEMFGELLETQQEKLKRVKKESKKSKNLLLAPHNPESLLELEDHSTVKKRKKLSTTTKIPKSIPMTEKVVKLRTDFENAATASLEDLKAAKIQSKKGEINWMLRNNPKMTKIIGSSYNPIQADLANDGKRGEIPVPIGRGQGEFIPLNRIRSPNESLQEESGGASASSSGQSSSVPAAGEAALPSLKQFITSVYEFQDMQPSSEMKVIKNPDNFERNPMNSSIETMEQLEASSPSFDDMRKFDQSHNTDSVKPLATRKNNLIKFSTKGKDDDENKPLKSKLSPSSSPSPSRTKGPVRQMTNKDGIKNQRIFLQENGNTKMGNVKSSTETDNNNNAKSSKADTISNNNARNQKSSPILITVPYFNPKRLKLAEELNPNPNSHEDDDDNNNQKKQIISIPFPRTLYNSFKNSNQDQPQPTERSNDDHKGLHLKLPSVSKILNVTMPKEQTEALERWQAKMIAQMGEEGFRLYKENMLNNGKMLHSNIESYMRGTPLDEICVAETNSGHWSSLKNIIIGVQGVKVLESRVVHPKLMYCGIVDCVAMFRNKLVVIDWKTSQKQKPFVSMTYDTPLQIAAYIGAINYDPNYSLKIDEGLIVIAYEDGTIGHTFLLRSFDVAKYWGKWLERLNLFNQMNQSSTLSSNQ